MKQSLLLQKEKAGESRTGRRKFRVETGIKICPVQRLREATLALFVMEMIQKGQALAFPLLNIRDSYETSSIFFEPAKPNQMKEAPG